MALLFCNKSDHIYCSELPKRELILSVLKRVYKLLYKQSTKTYKHEISPPPPPKKNPRHYLKKITRHHKIFLMSPAHTIVYHTKYSYYAKNWKIDIFRFLSWKLWKPATFHMVFTLTLHFFRPCTFATYILTLLLDLVDH